MPADNMAAAPGPAPPPHAACCRAGPCSPRCCPALPRLSAGPKPPLLGAPPWGAQQHILGDRRGGREYGGGRMRGAVRRAVPPLSPARRREGGARTARAEPSAPRPSLPVCFPASLGERKPPKPLHKTDCKSPQFMVGVCGEAWCSAACSSCLSACSSCPVPRVVSSQARVGTTRSGTENHLWLFV